MIKAKPMVNRVQIYCICALLMLLSITDTTQTQAQDTGGWTPGPCMRCDQIYDLAFSPDVNGKILAVASTDGLTLYDNSNHFLPTLGDQVGSFGSQALLARLTDGEATYKIAWSHYGTLLAAFQGTAFTSPSEAHLRIWDMTTRKVIKELPTSTTYITFDWSPVENILAYGVDDHINVWNADDDTIYQTLFRKPPRDPVQIPPRDRGLIWRIAWNPHDKDSIAVSTRDEGILVTAQFYEVVKSFDFTVKPWETMIWDPEGTSLLTINEWGTSIQLIDVSKETSTPLKLDHATVAAWNPILPILATGPRDYWNGEEWNTANQGVESPYAAPAFGRVTAPDQYRITALAWSPNGRQIAFGGNDGSVFVKRETLKTLKSLYLPNMH